jgi:hypothetical protein
MATKSFRVRTQVGQEQNLTFELKQDFDLLEILSLSLTQKDIYTRMCADFGVVVGRVIINSGFGVPNCKVSIFVPVEDSENDIIKELYPFKQPYDKGSDGTRYNLLSRESNFDCHTAVGSFPMLDDVLTNQDVEYVYKKYYKYTVKTNDSGDFMIYGVPTGEQKIIMDVDMSDIGCFSMLPEDFKLKGYPESDFDGPHFKTDREIDSLPQIVNQQKILNINPFWGDKDDCNASITRVDFDLGDSGMKLEPKAVFMGSTATDDGKNYVNKNCRPKRHTGELCKITTKPGIIDCIRYTPFSKQDPLAYPVHTTGVSYGAPEGGEVPILERYYLKDGGRVIDDSGAFLEHIPMNLDHLTTNEFGDLVKSYDPEVGVATRARCRFRVRPDQGSGGARQARIGSFLVPNLREFNYDNNTDGDWPGIDYRSYAFSIEYRDYHPYAQRHLIPSGDDYFYDMKFNMVYTPSQFHDHVKHNHRRGFVGIKEIMPEAIEQCPDTAMPFPVNTAFRHWKLKILLNLFIIDILFVLYAFLTLVVSVIGLIIGLIFPIVMLIVYILCWIVCILWSFFNWLCNLCLWGWCPFNFACATASALNSFAIKLGCAKITWEKRCQGECNSSGECGCLYFGFKLGVTLFSLNQTKFPECQKCVCRATPDTNADMQEYRDATLCSTDEGISDSSGAGCPDFYNSGGSAAATQQPASAFDLLYWNEEMCCEGDDDQICCPNEYGWASAGGSNWSAGAGAGSGPGSNQVDPAGAGCYVKTVCFRIKCFGKNINLTTLKEWRRRQKVASALCNGVMTYFWENDWVNGFLYQHQFKAKTKFDIAGYDDPVGKWELVNDTPVLNTMQNQDSFEPSSKFCRKTTYLHPYDNVFYYRSTPTRQTNAQTADYIYDTDGVRGENWIVSLFGGGGNSSDNTHSQGDMDRHILFPTTMVDMGSRNQCIQQICLDPRFGDECSITDQISSTTYQGIEDMIGDIYNLKMDMQGAVLRSFYSRPEKEIGGDVAQMLQQNSMLGIVGYEPNYGDLICACNQGLNPAQVNAPTSGSGLVLPYPPVTYTHNSSGLPHSISAHGNFYNIEWTPIIGDVQAPLLLSGQDLIDCATLELSSTTQDVPFYKWSMTSGGFGTHHNDWEYTKGMYSEATANWLGFDPMGLFGLWPQNLHEAGTVTSGWYQDDMYPTLDRPPLVSSSDPKINFSQPLYYYFGVRPGRTAYNTFIRKYVDEALADTVI